jgi:hypothetical protein
MHKFLTQNEVVTRTSLNKLLKRFLAPYFFVLVVFIAIGSWNQVGFHEGFNVGDWLINYQGGFVRRGLLGEGLYQLARLSSVSPAILLVFLQTIIFSVYFLFSYKVLLRKNDLLKYIILIFSPFLFTFAINSQAGGYRKEIIYFAVLLFLTYAQETYTPLKYQKIFFWILFFYPVVIFTDELGVAILPLMVGIFWNKVRPSSMRVILYLFFLLIENAAAFFIVIFHHQVSLAQVNAIIDSLIQTGYDPRGSGGAIGALHSSILANTKDTFHSILSAKYYLYYPLALLLVSIAYVPLRKEIKIAFQNKILFLGYLGSILILLPVFIIANDWGRWLYILLVELFVMILVVDTPQKSIFEITEASYRKSSIAFGSLFLVSYAVFWYLPHVLEDDSTWRNLFHNLPFIHPS